MRRQNSTERPEGVESKDNIRVSGRRYQATLHELQPTGDPNLQMVCLTELNDMLSMSSEDSLIASGFPLESFINAFHILLQVGTPDIMLLSTRAITNLLDIIPNVSHCIVQHNIIPTLCEKLANIEYMDVAEQSLSALRRIASDQPTPILRANGLAAILTFLDFFPASVQRDAALTVSLVCKNVPTDGMPLITDALPSLSNLLDHHDAVVVHSAIRCFIHLLESSPDTQTAEMLASYGLIDKAVVILNQRDTERVSHPSIKGCLQLLIICVRLSISLTRILLGQNIEMTLLQFLYPVSADQKDTKKSSQEIHVRDFPLSNSVSFYHTQSPELAQEAIRLIIECLPRVSNNGQKSCLPPISDTSSIEEYGEQGRRRLRFKKQTHSNSSQNVLAKDRVQFFQNNPTILHQFCSMLLAAMINVFKTTANYVIMGLSLVAIQQMISLLTPGSLEEIIVHMSPSHMTHFLTRLLLSSHVENNCVAIQLASILMTKKPDLFRQPFLRQGIIKKMVEIAEQSTLPTYSTPRSSLSSKIMETPATSNSIVAERTPIPRAHTFVSPTKTDSDAQSLSQMACSFLVLHFCQIQKDKCDYADEEECRTPRSSGSAITNSGKFTSKIESNLEELMNSLMQSNSHTMNRLKIVAEKLTHPNLRLFSWEEKHQKISALIIGPKDEVPVVQSKSVHSVSIADIENQWDLESSDALLSFIDLLDSSEGISTYEFQESGILSALIHYLTHIESNKTPVDDNGNDLVHEQKKMPEFVKTRFSYINRLRRIHNFMAAFMVPQNQKQVDSSAESLEENQNQPLEERVAVYHSPIVSLINILHESIDARERFSIISSSAAGDTIQIGLKMLKQSIRLRLCQDEGSSIKLRKGGYDNVVLVEPLASLQSVRDFLESKLSRFLREPSSRAGKKRLTFRSQKRKEEAESIEINSKEREEETKDESMHLILLARGKPIPSCMYSTSMLQVITKLLCSLSSLEEASENSPMLGPELWNQDFCLTYRLVESEKEEPVSEHLGQTRDEAIDNLHMEETMPYFASDSRDLFCEAKAGLTEAVSILDVQLTPHLPGVDCIPRGSEFDVIVLLRLLYLLVSNCDHLVSLSSHPQFSEERDATSGATCPLKNKQSLRQLDTLSLLQSVKPPPLDIFCSARISTKLLQQLHDPLVIGSGCLPKWCNQLTRFCPFMFPFDVRKAFFYCTCMGPTRSISYLQNLALSHYNKDSVPVVCKLQKLKARVSRSYILESAVKILSRYGSKRAQLEIEFGGEAGTGLGPTMEFFTLASHEMQRKDLDLWRYDSTTKVEMEESSRQVGSQSDSMEEITMEEDIDRTDELRTPHEKSLETSKVEESDDGKGTGLTVKGTYSENFPNSHKSARKLSRSIEESAIDGEEYKEFMHSALPPTPQKSSLLYRPPLSSIPLASSATATDISLSSLSTPFPNHMSFQSLPPRDLMKSASTRSHSSLSPSPFKNHEYVAAHHGLFPSPLLPSATKTPTRARDTIPREILHAYKYFSFLGRLFAQALMDRRLLDLPLAKPFYKAILQKPLFVSIESGIKELEELDPISASTISRLHKLCLEKSSIEHDMTLSDEQKKDRIFSISLDGASIEDLGLDFTLPGYPHIQLVKDGNEKDVNIWNLELYLSRVIQVILEEGINVQLRALRNGFEEVLPVSNLQCFTEEELQLLLCGDVEEWTTCMLTDCTKCDHGYTHTCQPIQWLFEVLAELSPQDKKNFLRFVTGSPSLPVGGLRNLQPRLTIVPKAPEPGYPVDIFLPSASTCINYLKLPRYTSKQALKERFLYSIREGHLTFYLS